MKIFKDDCVYVQLNDIAYLNSSDFPVPLSIYLTAFGDNSCIINDHNRFDFIKFDNEIEIDFFKNMDWILDYGEVKGLSIHQLIEMGQGIANKKDEVAKQYNSLSIEERKNNKELVIKHDLLEYKMFSLRDYIFYKQGKLPMVFPEDESKKNTSKKEKCIKKFFKKNKNKIER